MARKITYNLNRFDGGMTDAIRDTSNPTKFAYISHFDIYRDRNQMYTMPGYVSENGFNDDANGVKTHDIRAFYFTSGAQIYALGTKSDGTGSKLFQRDFGETQWKIPSSAAYQVEGTKTIAPRPYLLGSQQLGAAEFYFPIINGTPLIGSGGTRTNIIRQGPDVSGDIEEWREQLAYNAPSVTQLMYEQGFTGAWYIYPVDQLTGVKGAGLITSSNLTTAKSTTPPPYAMKTGNYQVAYAISPSAPETNSRLVLWDSASLLADQNIALGSGFATIIGFPSNLWSVVIGEYTSTSNRDKIQSNGTPSMSVKLISGESPDTVYRTYMPTNTNVVVEQVFNANYRDAMTWYARIPTNSAGTEFKQGIWAFGKGSLDTQMGVSVLLNTESLGRVETAHFNGLNVWFAHGQDGSVSRLADFETGTYNVPAVIETLVYGAQSPYLKELNGISVVTENLPASSSVKVDYRTDVDSAWVELGTSNTTGKQKHQFTRANGTPIGRFQEIQFRITCTGKIVLKNIKIDITETNDLAF